MSNEDKKNKSKEKTIVTMEAFTRRSFDLINLHKMYRNKYTTTQAH